MSCLIQCIAYSFFVNIWENFREWK